MVGEELGGVSELDEAEEVVGEGESDEDHVSDGAELIICALVYRNGFLSYRRL